MSLHRKRGIDEASDSVSPANEETFHSTKKPKLADSSSRAASPDSRVVERQPIYTVKICDEVFRLSQSQILFDRPSYFTVAFSRDWAESETQEVEIVDRSANLFREYIRDWLSGYELDWDAILAKPTIHANLKKDADFYNLRRLRKKLEHLGQYRGEDRTTRAMYYNGPGSETFTLKLPGEDAYYEKDCTVWEIYLTNVTCHMTFKHIDPPWNPEEEYRPKDLVICLDMPPRLQGEIAGRFGGEYMSSWAQVMLGPISPTTIPVRIDSLTSSWQGTLHQFRAAAEMLLNHPYTKATEEIGAELAPACQILWYAQGTTVKGDITHREFKLKQPWKLEAREMMAGLAEIPDDTSESGFHLELAYIDNVHFETQAVEHQKRRREVAQDLLQAWREDEEDEKEKREQAGGEAGH